MYLANLKRYFFVKAYSWSLGVVFDKHVKFDKLCTKPLLLCLQYVHLKGYIHHQQNSGVAKHNKTSNMMFWGNFRSKTVFKFYDILIKNEK